MDPLTKFKPHDLQPGWTWRTRDGKYVHPGVMPTHHLFFTLRMIWHNTMPPEAWVMGNPRLYRFGPSYPDEYLMLAIRHLSAELAQREDMTPEWSGQLARMIAFFQEVVQPPQALEV